MFDQMIPSCLGKSEGYLDYWLLVRLGYYE